MKYLVTVAILLFLAGCSSQPKIISAENSEGGVAVSKPEGYPKTEIRALPDQPGFCVAVTESWREGSRDGQTVWLKEAAVESASCTKTQWYELARHY
ncbi:hypothetical protein [Marinobacter sp. CHS3-4]|uniref:hypothetical protein n=1 Tax=Marinobacter sp. CHS3-4 TaxID=3045174 RepID=UPI0024B56F59|nr:hypothetical protein [Marinobacter sp. CHS3-4]MDI9244718.1 hypothetical protein [Marinobacter sp. CHS3-4]